MRGFLALAFAQRAAAAFLAPADRSAAVSRLARVVPPLRPARARNARTAFGVVMLPF